MRFVKMFSSDDENKLAEKINEYAYNNDVEIVSVSITVQKRVIDNDKMFAMVIFEPFELEEEDYPEYDT